MENVRRVGIPFVVEIDHHAPRDQVAAHIRANWR